MPHAGIAKVAQCEDYNSDDSSAVPDTLVEARSHQQKQKQHQQQQQQQQRDRHARPHLQHASSARQPKGRDAASDSGYSTSSHNAPLTAKSAAAAPIAIPARNTGPQPPISPSRTKPKPVIHRADSARSTQRAHTVTAPSSKQSKACTDANCRDPNCLPTRPADERRYSQQPHPQPQYPNAAQYQQMNQYQYASLSQAQAAAMMPPPPVPRPRAGSASRQARPASIHGYSSLSYSGTPTGPPPSTSAYYAYSQPYPQQQLPYLDTAAANQVAAYPMSPVPPSPGSPSMAYPGFPGSQGTYSARQVNPSVPGLEMVRPAAVPGVTRTMSARHIPIERARGPVTGAYADVESMESESDSTSDSEFSSDDEYDRRNRDPRRYSRTESATIPRRPVMNRKYATETVLPVRARRGSLPRESPRRAPRSDTFVDYPSSSEIGDSDRTARAVVDRRSTVSSGRSSRRPSIATTASSGRTKATTLSSTTDYSRGQVVVEGRNGRQTAYLSKQEQAELRRYQQQQLEERLEEQRLREEKIAAYQKNMSGGDPYELTAENMRKANNRKSGSHVSGRSLKSAGSGSKAAKSEGIQIKSGDTVLHVYGDAKIEMRPGDDGGPAQFVIASSNGRDSDYRTNSSGSRIGRSRGRSDLSHRVIREENDYEDGYEVAR